MESYPMLLGIGTVLCVLVCMTSCAEVGTSPIPSRARQVELWSGEWSGRLGTAYPGIHSLRRRGEPIADRYCKPRAGGTFPVSP